jgi:hypothetical protein
MKTMKTPPPLPKNASRAKRALKISLILFPILLLAEMLQLAARTMQNDNRR